MRTRKSLKSKLLSYYLNFKIDNQRYCPPISLYLYLEMLRSVNPILFRCILLFGLFVILQCNSPTYLIIIDNPKEADIKLRVDNQDFTIYGLDLLTLRLTQGEHRFQAFTASDSLFFEFAAYVKTDGIVNPHLATYVQWYDAYTVEAATTFQNNLDMTIDEKRYNNVDFEVYEAQPFITRTWDYSLFDPWEKALEFYTKTNTIRSKIYRLQTIEELWGYSMPFEEISLDLKSIEGELNKISQKLKELEKD